MSVADGTCNWCGLPCDEEPFLWDCFAHPGDCQDALDLLLDGEAYAVVMERYPNGR